MAAAKKEAEDPEPEPDGEPEPEPGGGNDDEEQAWQRLAPRLKALHRETLNEWLDEVAASAPADTEDKEKHEPTRRTARPPAGDGGGVVELPKSGGREKAAGKAGGTLRGLFFGN